MMERRTGSYSSIVEAIDAGRMALLRSRLSRGLTRFAAAALGIVTLIVVWGVLQQAFSLFSVPLAGAASLVALISLLLALIKWVVLPVATMPDRNGFVALVEKRHPKAKNILVNAYQLGSEAMRQKHSGSQDVIEAVVAHTRDSLSAFDLRTWSSAKDDLRYFGLGIVSVLILVVLASVSEAPFKQALAQAIKPGLAAPPPVSLVVSPGNAAVDRGANLAVDVRVSGTGKMPTLRFREPGGAWRVGTFVARGRISREGGSYQGSLDHIERTLEYSVLAPRAESDIFSVRVNDPPRIQGFRLNVSYPAYTRLPLETMESASGDITALKGSRVDLRVLTNVPVASGHLEWKEDNRDVPERIELKSLNPTQWEAEVAVMQSGSYLVVLSDASGDPILRTPRYRVDPVLDRVPFLTLHLPQEDHDLYEDMMERVVADAADDYGFSAVEIVYQIDDGPEHTKDLRPYTTGQTEFRMDTLWDLSGLELIPGQVISFFVRVVDNDVITGPKAVRSDLRRVRFPTMAEMYNEVADEHSQEIENLSTLQKTQQEMQERLKKLSDDLKQGQKRDWDVEQDVKETLERQDRLDQQLEEIEDRLRDTKSKADSRAGMNDSLVRKMDQLNDLMESLSNEDLKRSFERLSNALSKRNSDELRRSLEDFQSQQEQMLAGLDRTIELLKQIRKEEHVDDLVRQAQEIAELQEEIAREMEAMGGVPPESQQSASESHESDTSEQEAVEPDQSKKAQAADSQIEESQELKNLQKDIARLQEEIAEEQARAEARQQEEAPEDQKGDESARGERKQSPPGESSQAESSQEIKDLEKHIAELKKQLSEMQAKIDAREEESAENREGQKGEESAQGEKKQGRQGAPPQQGQESQEGKESQQQEGQQSQVNQDRGERSKNGQQSEQQGEQASEQEEKQMEALAKKEASLRQEVEKLKRRLEQLKKLHQEDRELARNLEKMEQDENTQNLSKSMQNSQDSMSQGQKQKSTFYAFKAKEEASRLAQMAESAKESMKQGLQEESVARMEAVIQGLIDISRVEEGLVFQPHEEEQDQARHQFDLVEQTQAVAESLAALSRQTFTIDSRDQKFLDETVTRMERATRLYEMGNRRAGNHESEVSVSDLNATIVKLMKGHEQMCSGGSGEGSMQQLMQDMEGLSQAQEQLNGQAQRASQTGGERLSQTEKMRLNWLAAQQEMIRQGLEEIQKEFSESKDLLGDMQSLGQEMQEVESELRSQNLDRRVLERQQRILSRLLDAQRSVRQQEMSPKRQSKTGTLARRDAPPPLPKELVETNRTLEEDVLRGSQDRYPAQYRKLVEDYFKALTEQIRTPER